MLTNAAVLLMVLCAAGSAAAAAPTPYLPDLLALQNGTRVRDADGWARARRPEVQALLAEHLVGAGPAAPAAAALARVALLNTTTVGNDGAASTFLRLVYNTSGGRAGVDTVSLDVEVLAPDRTDNAASS